MRLSIVNFVGMCYNTGDMEIKKRCVDWQKTAAKLRWLREHDLTFKRNVCDLLELNRDKCCADCANCNIYETRSISRQKLAEAFCVHADTIIMHEYSLLRVPMEDLLFYAQLAETIVENIVCLKD